MPSTSRFSKGLAFFKTLTLKKIQGETSQDVNVQTVTDSKTVKINSRNYTQASGNSIGFQAKPAQTVASSGNVIGFEVSPRVNSGIALSGSGSVIGAHVDLKLEI